MTKVLYISSLCSERMLKYIYDTSIHKPEQAAQKFHRLLAQGFALNEANCNIQTLSTIPVTPINHKKKFWSVASEKSKGVNFKYVPMINIRFLKNFGVFFYTFFKILFWAWFRIGQKKVIICDVLNFTIAFASFLACRCSFTKNITIVTDLPYSIMAERARKKSILARINHKLITYMLHRFDGYILLTEQMNDVVNPKNRPYMIMEGLVDINMESSENILERKTTEKVLIYAGGLYEQYGVKMLIDAFMLTQDSNLRLHLYGNGDMVKDMISYTRKDTRIVYKGMVPNQEVVADQLKATLLINPRPSSEEFTKFSFPSKNMEYMVSGTPMLTNKLPGMPKEYWQYVYINEDESVEGMAASLISILEQSMNDLHSFGIKSKNFVLKEKNNEKQAARVLEFYKKLSA